MNLVRLQDIINEMRSHNPDVNVDEVKKAYVFSAKIHQSQLRRPGEPYLTHPINVAHIISQLNLDEPSVVAGLLHDALEDNLTTSKEIEDLFGPSVRFLIEGLSKLSKVSLNAGEERQAENVRKMLVAMSQDLRVIFLKLADRLHNMRTLENLDLPLREALAKETLDIFAPLANRLGIQWIRTELEDSAFRWLHPQQFLEISEKLEQVKHERQKYVDEVLEFLRKTLQENAIPSLVSGRLKHHYSIQRKMKQKGIEFDQIFDIIAFRIVTENIDQCYRALGVIHALWKPVIGRFKDYIAMPKINRYQSLHTTVLGPHGERVEIQIRTHEMHRVAEHGVAAHWIYKEGSRGRGRQNKDLSQFAWLRGLLEQHRDVKDPAEFLESVKVDLFSDEVFAFTPQGDVKALPFGATALDFAYLVHTDVGHHCVGARINGKIAPLRQKLKNGDTVEILTNPNQRPSKDWLTFVKTSGAKNKIRVVIRAEQRKRSEEIGREVLEKECKRHGVNLQRVWKSGEIGAVAQTLGFKNPDELLVALGYGKLSTARIIEKLVPPESREEAPETIEKSLVNKLGRLFKRPTKKSKTGILVQGLDDLMIRFAKCCSPIPGDDLVGVITRGRGVTVHSRGCRRLFDSDPERRIEVRWDSEHTVTRTIAVRVRCEDRPGLLANMSNVLSDAGINISQVNARVEDGQAVCSFKIGVDSLDQLQQVMRKLSKIKGVAEVERVQG